MAAEVEDEHDDEEEDDFNPSDRMYGIRRGLDRLFLIQETSWEI
jgi:hypothetical protein